MLKLKYFFIFLFLLVLALFAGCSEGNSGTTEPFIKTLSPTEFAKVIEDKEVFVLDTHIPEQNHIEGTDAFIAFDELENNTHLLPSDLNTPIALYCRSGSMSVKAAQTLQDMGYTKIYDLQGGFNAWSAESKPTTTSQFGEYGVKDRKVTIYKSPSCGCCVGYTAQMESEGYDVTTQMMDDLTPIKTAQGVPRNMESCHTAVVGGYFIEGHVPFEAVEKMLNEQPDIDGIALPNMPAGSPGMPGVKSETFTIYAVKDGKQSVFMII